MQLLAQSTSTWKTIARVKCRQRKKFINHKIMYLSSCFRYVSASGENVYEKFSIVHISFWDDEKIDFFSLWMLYVYETDIEGKFSISIMVYVNALSFTFLHSPDTYKLLTVKLLVCGDFISFFSLLHNLTSVIIHSGTTFSCYTDSWWNNNWELKLNRWHFHYIFCRSQKKIKLWRQSTQPLYYMQTTGFDYVRDVMSVERIQLSSH